MKPPQLLLELKVLNFPFSLTSLRSHLTDKIEQKMYYKGVVTLLHYWAVKETEISQQEVPYFLKIDFHMLNKTFKTWGKVGKSLQLPYANGAKFWPNMGLMFGEKQTIKSYCFTLLSKM